jgi:hypothetical protein
VTDTGPRSPKQEAQWEQFQAWQASQAEQHDPSRAPAPPRVARNDPATAGVALAVISVLFNPYLAPSILAVIYGSFGLSRSRRSGAGRERSLVAIIAGALSTVGYFAWFVWQISQF